MNQTPQAAPIVACKCCGQAAPRFGSVDFAKSCEDRHAKVLPPAGWLVDYHRCAACGFLFSPFLDGWDAARQRREIYNQDYIRVDPEFGAARAAKALDVLDRLFGAPLATLRILDHGGGDGTLARALEARGCREVCSIDPFHGATASVAGRFDLMVCIEVVEHLTRPDDAFAAARRHLAEPGVMLFSTLLQPADILRQGVDWWYAAPRNGHVSLHSTRSLEIIAQRHGLRVGSFNETLHLAWCHLPAFAAHLVPGQSAAPATPAV